MRVRRGFTLIELISVIAIAAVIMAIGVTYMRRANSNTSVGADANRVKSILSDASSQARAFAPTGTQTTLTNAAATSTSVEFDEAQLFQGNTKKGNISLDPMKGQVQLTADLDSWVTSNINTNPWYVKLYNKGVAGKVIQVFDSSGGAAADLTMTISNDSVTSEVRSVQGTSTITVKSL